MWMTVLIAGGLFMAMLAMLWLNVEDIEKRRAEEGKGTLPAAPTAPGHCMLCDSPLPRHRTAEQVVCDLEHRIHSDLQDIDRVLATPQHVHRLYLS